ncbi:MAG: DUF3303 domain-containing protein [Peptococcaceae bacterium]
MLYVCSLSEKNTAQKVVPEITQRPKGQYPKEVRSIAEYWLQTDNPRVISIFEADDYDNLLKIVEPWEKSYDVKITPAMTSEDLQGWMKA